MKTAKIKVSISLTALRILTSVRISRFEIISCTKDTVRISYLNHLIRLIKHIPLTSSLLDTPLCIVQHNFIGMNSLAAYCSENPKLFKVISIKHVTTTTNWLSHCKSVMSILTPSTLPQLPSHIINSEDKPLYHFVACQMFTTSENVLIVNN